MTSQQCAEATRPIVPSPAGLEVSADVTDRADLTDVVVCSFYTGDRYYRRCGAALREGLTRLGVAHELIEVTKEPEQDWADICRRKVGFLAGVCERNPDKRVFWIDVDCGLIDFPEHIATFTADIIGFQRGFGTPLAMGYPSRTGFWEPCFFGINTGANARKLVTDAHELEQRTESKATDSYFFEESWRLNAPYLSFQVIPSIASLPKAAGAPQGVGAFFSFGGSLDVNTLKDPVVPHRKVGGTVPAPWLRRLRKRAAGGAKLIRRTLPAGIARPLRHAYAAGKEQVLTAEDELDGAGGAGSAHRELISRAMIAASRQGKVEHVEASYARLRATGIVSPTERAAKGAADSFAYYASRDVRDGSIALSWQSRPFPGNLGDWLSPLVLASRTDRSITHQAPSTPSLRTHLVSVGSIGRFIKPSSIVVGTGISSTDVELSAEARYHSVRGPLTAQLLLASGGSSVECFGDPAALIRRIYPVRRGPTNGKVALVRHVAHASVPVRLAEGMDELSLHRSHPQQIEAFVTDLARYDAVVTSAMQVMVLCHSYGIPCVPITFDGLSSSGHGTDIEYKDYAVGAGLEDVSEPIVVSTDLRGLALRSMASREFISDTKLDEIQAAVDAAIGDYLDRTG